MKRCSTACYHGNANYNNAIPPIHLSERLKSEKFTLPTNCWEDVEQQEGSFIASKSAKWYDHFGRQFGGFLQN